jgi:hypothetical protein
MEPMRFRVSAMALVLVAASVARADLKREEQEFGEHVYKSMRTIHDQTCSCKDDGNCMLKVSREELKAELDRFSESVKTVVPRLWPTIASKMASMSTEDARAYGERLGQSYLDRLPRKEVLLWARMLSSCWGTSQAPAEARSEPHDDDDTEDDSPHDGSLNKSGEINDLRNGKLDEASGIATFLQGCRKTSRENPNGPPFCACLSDYLRVSPHSVIRVLKESSETGDASKLVALPGVTRCRKWVMEGSVEPRPFLRKGMKSSVDVETQFVRCRTTMTKGKPTPSGVTFCNRVVATTP